MPQNRPAREAPPAASIQPAGPWWKDLNRYHWFVFSMASLAWLFDCLDQQLFIIARNPAISALLPPGTPPEVLQQWGSNSTAIFVAGWATGGSLFRWAGALVGPVARAKRMRAAFSPFCGSDPSVRRLLGPS